MCNHSQLSRVPCGKLANDSDSALMAEASDSIANEMVEFIEQKLYRFWIWVIDAVVETRKLFLRKLMIIALFPTRLSTSGSIVK